ncbi:hypothetical protein [Amycolatopsis mediterranei]|uniref:hypothetical protein n=1 Tax=Amycolatopsis mediterranei TaxID=33910 RepID=UPI00222E8E3C|nr:hypothetical protein [Amycolatopsis mediterranei]
METDDVSAEVARLTALGAKPVSRWLECHTLRAPGGPFTPLVWAMTNNPFVGM